MRIIAGKWRGKKLRAGVSAATRPTSDRAKESLFNIVENKLRRMNRTWADVVMADVFAGSGAVGLEALSRGAKKAYFIENEREALAGLKVNLKECGVVENDFTLNPTRPPLKIKGRGREQGEDKEGAIVVAQDAMKIGKAGVACDFIFMDPPYGKGLVEKALVALDAGGWIADEAVIVTEVEKRETVTVDGFEVIEERVYGIAKFVFLTKRARVLE